MIDIKVSFWIEKLNKIFHPNKPQTELLEIGVFLSDEWWVTKIE